MNQSGIQKTIGAMLLASGATLAIVILGGEAIRTLQNASVWRSDGSESAGSSAWGKSHNQSTPWPSQNELTAQNNFRSPNGYPATNRNSSSQQTNHPTMGQARPVGYVSESNFAAEQNPHQIDHRALQNRSYEITNYPVLQRSNGPQHAQSQAIPNSPAAPQRVLPDYQPLQRLPQDSFSPTTAIASAIPSTVAMRPAEPTPATRPRTDTSNHFKMARERSVLENAAAESSVLEADEPFAVAQASFETRVVKPDSRLTAPHLTSQILINKHAIESPEISIEDKSPVPPKPEPKPSAKPAQTQAQTFGAAPQPSVLPRQRVNPQVEARARKRIEYGGSLSRRQSFHAAREEFILSLLLISNSHGNESTNNAHSDRLAKALTAMDEIRDFSPMLNRSGRDPRFQQTIRSHKTRLVAESDFATISPRKATDLYCGFAQSNIEQALGFSAAGSEALHALGKLELMAPKTGSLDGATHQTKALVFFRASMSVNPSNALCANDLGILLFDMGRLNEAEEALRRSLGSAQSRLVWSNLASVHKQQASLATNADQRNQQLRLAQMAETEAQKFQNDPRARGLADNEWATSSEFQNNAAFPDTVVQGASGVAGESSQRGGAREKAVSFLQKVTGVN